MRLLATAVAGAFGALTLLLATGAAAGSAAPSVSVSPASGLLDAPFRIRVTGLSAGQPVQVQLREAAYPRGTLTLSQPAKADARGVAELEQPLLLARVAPAAARG